MFVALFTQVLEVPWVVSGACRCFWVSSAVRDSSWATGGALDSAHSSIPHRGGPEGLRPTEASIGLTAQMLSPTPPRKPKGTAIPTHGSVAFQNPLVASHVPGPRASSEKASHHPAAAGLPPDFTPSHGGVHGAAGLPPSLAGGPGEGCPGGRLQRPEAASSCRKGGPLE